MLVTLNDLLPKLERSQSCLPGFDIAGGHPDFIQGVLQACQAAHSPALLLIYAPAATYMGLEAGVELALFYAKRATIPVVLHLDHGNSPELVEQAINLGFSSVMFDGSSLDFKENIRITASVTKTAHARNISVEGEVGNIGAEIGTQEKGRRLTNPSEAETFVKETGIDFLAPAVGNIHGFTKGTPQLQFDLIREIHERCAVPLSLHGGTDIPFTDIIRGAALGIRKLNVASLLHKLYADSLDQVSIADKQKQYSWKVPLLKGRDAISACVRKYLKELNVENLV